MRRYSAPGRINLIGEHTDYNLGWALPIALPQRVVAEFCPDGSDSLRVRSAVESATATIPLTTTPGQIVGWAAYVAGVVWALGAAGYPVAGGDMTITSDVEIGAGLSSSAALECAVLGALTDGGFGDGTAAARVAQRAENGYVGAPTGLMDQLASLLGTPGHALLIDFRELTVRQIPFAPETAGVTLLVANSRAAHRHADGEYAARRASCERVAAALGVASLRDLGPGGLDALRELTGTPDGRRARHVITENQRVLDFVAALENTDFRTAGHLMTQSHTSMRDDFEITTAHLDLIAQTAVDAGAFGARMTGGGFGGCVISLVPTALVGTVRTAVHTAVGARGYPEPTFFVAHAAAGAGRERLA